jgi:hypothetical protein
MKADFDKLFSEELRKAKSISLHRPCSPALLKKLRDGASKAADLLPEVCREVLDEQGLI